MLRRLGRLLNLPAGEREALLAEKRLAALRRDAATVPENEKITITAISGFPEEKTDQRNIPGERLDFSALCQISFEEPDEETFRGLALARDAAERGGSMPTVFNAANEYAVREFLNRRISYLEITEMIQAAMERHAPVPDPSVEEILETEASVYDFLESR